MTAAEKSRTSDYEERFPGIAPIFTEWLNKNSMHVRGSVASRARDRFEVCLTTLGTYRHEKIYGWDMEAAQELVLEVLDMREAPPESLTPALRQAAEFAVLGLPESARVSLTLTSRGLTMEHESAILGTAHLIAAVKQGYGTETQGPNAEDHFNAGIVHLAKGVNARINPRMPIRG